MGMQALGQPFKDAAFRLEQVCRLLDVSENDRITPAHLFTLIQKAYLEPLKQQYPGIPIKVHCTAQTLYQRAVAAMIEAGEDASLLQPAWFSEKPVSAKYKTYRRSMQSRLHFLNNRCKSILESAIN